MIKIEAWSLEEAYTLASEELGCSITEIEYEVTQYPSKGFLGIGKKKAILVAMKKVSSKSAPQKQSAPSENLPQTQNRLQKQDKKPEVKEIKIEQPQKTVEAPIVKQSVKESYVADKQIDDNFFREKRDINEICEEIEIDINKLFACSCFDLEPVTVEPYDEETVLISFSGQDSALLIGKEGYRYKALSYLIFNWVNSKYNLLIRLEIAEFLRNQEDMIRNYLEPLIDQIYENRRGQTKVLDGVLIQIALKALREEFADLYVGVKTNDDGSKYIIVNEFYTKQNVK
jgi:spoIIIJ-associated protein